VAQALCETVPDSPLCTSSAAAEKTFEAGDFDKVSFGALEQTA